MAYKFIYRLALVSVGVIWAVYYVSYMKLVSAPSMLQSWGKTDETESHLSIDKVKDAPPSILHTTAKTYGISSHIAMDEVKHVSLLKVHKTGSSSVQNILLRFIDSRNLTMVFPHSPDHPDSSNVSNVISYDESLTDRNIVPPPAGRDYDMLCCHVIFDETSIGRYLPNDTVYIGIVRDPFTRLESAFSFFGLLEGMSISEYAKNPLRYDRRGPSMANNRMAYEFGFPRDIFPTPEHPVIDRDIAQSYLANISKRFDLILINERMEESLVYMRRLLRWTLKDIIFVKQKVGKQEMRRFTEGDKLNLSTFLYLDIILHNYSVEAFDLKFQQLGQDGIDEVSFFRDILSKVGKFCQEKTADYILLAESTWSGSINITRHDCFLYTWHEQEFIQRLREKTYGTVYN